jgi:pimeloyl-ACP methyl ester carboxylesterase
MTTTTTTPRITGTEHWVASDGLKLFVWEKRLATSNHTGERPQPSPATLQTPSGARQSVALLVHGATYSGPTVYDVQAPSKNYSLMDHLAARGWDVFTFAIRGYGRSDRPADGFSVTTDAAVRDIAAVADYIRAQRGVEAVDLFGWSWGGSTTALYAQRNPSRVRRLVMFAGGAGAPNRAAQQPTALLEAWVTSTRETVMARIEQDAAVPEAQEALVQGVLKWEARSPNGVRRQAQDGGAALRPDPTQLTVPTLLIYGARDSAYQPENVANFFARINNPDKALVVVPDAGHFLMVQKPYLRLFTAAERWFSTSPPSPSP